MTARQYALLAGSCAIVAWTIACKKRETGGSESSTHGSRRTTGTGESYEKPWFREVAAQSGVIFQHSSGRSGHFYMPEMETGGVGLIDYDNDGLLDIYLVNGGSLDPASTNAAGNKLFHNLGNWRFEDVTERAGVAAHSGYGMGCACADYDGDGYTDIYVTKLGKNILYHNNGDGTFSDTTEKAGVGDGSWSTSAAFFDFDQDGFLDLIVVNYIRWTREAELQCASRGGRRDYCSPLNYNAPAMDTLYRNRGDGTFENVTAKAGLDHAYGNGLGVATCDFNRDGRPDIFVANDALPNQLWINQGDGTFKDEAAIRGVAVNRYGVARAGMGAVAVDLNEDGWFDLFVTHLVGEGNGLFLNEKGFFNDVTPPGGPNAGSIPFTGFGVGFADFNNDGLLDVYIANGRVRYGNRDLDASDPYAEPSTLLRGIGGARFEEVQPKGGVGQALLATSRGAAVGDLNNDGGIDVVVVNKDGAAWVLRNEAYTQGHWVSVKALNGKGNYMHNAVVEVEAGGRRQAQQLQPNQGYCSSNDPRVHFGLGSAAHIDRLIVIWPGGVREEFGPFQVDQVLTVVRGKGKSSL